jgi:hypothetical protein
MLQGEALGRVALGELAASTALAISAAHGTFALTFQSVASQVSIAAESGTFTLSGQSAATAVSLPAAQGAFTLSGQAATLTSTLVMTATPYIDGEKIQFGFAALGEVGLGQMSASSARTFALNWQSAVSSFSLPVESGTFTVTGRDAVLFTGRILNPVAGAYSLTGYDAAFQINMPAQTGLFVLSGQTIDVLRRIPKIRAFPRVGNPAFSAASRGRDTIKIRAFGG